MLISLYGKIPNLAFACISLAHPVQQEFLKEMLLSIWLWIIQSWLTDSSTLSVLDLELWISLKKKSNLFFSGILCLISALALIAFDFAFSLSYVHL